MIPNITNRISENRGFPTSICRSKGASFLKPLIHQGSHREVHPVVKSMEVQTCSNHPSGHINLVQKHQGYLFHLASGNGYGTSPSFITVNQLYKFGPFISIANSEKSLEATNSDPNSDPNGLPGVLLYNVCRKLNLLMSAIYSALRGPNWPKYPSDAWLPGQVWLPFESANLMELDGLHSGSPSTLF